MRFALSGVRLCDERFAAARRAVHQNASAYLLAVLFEQERVLERVNNVHADLLFKLAKPSYVFERDVRQRGVVFVLISLLHRAVYDT